MPRSYSEIYSKDNPCRLDEVNSYPDEFTVGEGNECFSIRNDKHCDGVITRDNENFACQTSGLCANMSNDALE